MTDKHPIMELVILESPFAAPTAEEVSLHVAYAKACLVDCLGRGEAPLASHLLYAQNGVLDDRDPIQRGRGIVAGLAWASVAHRTVVYTDLGISPGMSAGIEHAERLGRPVEQRELGGDWARLRSELNEQLASAEAAAASPPPPGWNCLLCGEFVPGDPLRRPHTCNDGPAGIGE